MRTFALFALAALVGCSRPPSNCGIIHRPDNGCPAGYLEKPGVFHRDGKDAPACVSAAKPHCVDYLAPREAVNIDVVVQVGTGAEITLPQIGDGQ